MYIMKFTTSSYYHCIVSVFFVRILFATVSANDVSIRFGYNLTSTALLSGGPLCTSDELTKLQIRMTTVSFGVQSVRKNRNLRYEEDDSQNRDLGCGSAWCDYYCQCYPTGWCKLVYPWCTCRRRFLQDMENEIWNQQEHDQQHQDFKTVVAIEDFHPSNNSSVTTLTSYNTTTTHRELQDLCAQRRATVETIFSMVASGNLVIQGISTSCINFLNANPVQLSCLVVPTTV